MGGLDAQTIMIAGGALVGGGIAGWLVCTVLNGRNIDKVESDWKTRFDGAIRHKEKVEAQLQELSTSQESQKADLQRHQQAVARAHTEIESQNEKVNTLNKNMFVISAERDELKGQVANHQNTLNAAKRRIVELKTEFSKSKEFLQSQLESAVEQRQAMGRRLDAAKEEHQSLNNLLTAARSEHQSVSNLLASAQARLENLEALEKKVITLEAQNAELKRSATLAQRDADEMQALRDQNKELVHCLESMEASRKQYEEDARRYRSQYQESEQESDTLRFKLGDIEENWAKMQRKKEHDRKAEEKNNSKVPAFGLKKPDGEKDDLTQIIGVGKVFERTLHDLGIFHFRQIATFGPTEIARINAELKEFKGRIEHDDWIGQAKELHFRKYGNNA